ncbi:adenosylmethionine--8-amino-7-oxononanoate transaminase [Limibacter armeniacum]|uniref:adenosylmethionine--8-amino-7-oxononanoate transaminase n=1 Tax=Limibacter armeniacum TaxID=466084 RepID=UPI002FE690CC
MMDLKERDRKYVWHPFTPQRPQPEILPVKKAFDCTLVLEDGREVIDAISSWWVNLHGHGNKYIAEAAAKQARELEHVIFAGFTHEPAVQLAERLIGVLPGDQAKVFYSDNGSTATEVGMKMAFQYFWNKGEQHRRRIISFEGAYHGDTFGAMSVGDRGPFSQPFFPYLFDVDAIPYPESGKEYRTIEQFREVAERGDVAAFIYEPLVQGSGGMRMYSPKVLDELLSVAKEHGILCIADEVMTGFGRTGNLFASEYMEHKPDIMCLSKGLTGGTLALGVTTCVEKVYEAYLQEDIMKTFFHGHSFTANPIACAVANASLDMLLSLECQDSIQEIVKRHEVFAEKAQSFAFAKNIRQRGTILALEYDAGEQASYFNKSRNYLYESFLKKGILLRPLGNVVYILPPYVISEKELNAVYAAIEDVFNQ